MVPILVKLLKDHPGEAHLLYLVLKCLLKIISNSHVHFVNNKAIKLLSINHEIKKGFDQLKVLLNHKSFRIRQNANLIIKDLLKIQSAAQRRIIKIDHFNQS